MKGGKKKVDELEALGSKELHGSKLLEFSFCLLYLRLGAGEAYNPEIPIITDKKSPRKAYFL